MCMCVHCRLSRIIFPSLARGRLGLGKGHGMATQALAWHVHASSFQFNFFIFFFILFRTLSLHRRGMPS